MRPVRHFSKSLIILTLLLFAPAHVAFAGQIKLAWNPVDDPRVIGYKIHFGTASRNYPNVQNAHTSLTYLATNLSDTKTYYFAVTAYSSESESDYSEELIVNCATACSHSRNIVPFLHLLFD